ncbi:MAG: glycosyltransferase family 2 protein [Syntrophothermus sp.]
MISVIIPTYNRVNALRRALHALDNQTEEGGPFEAIVIDDGSTDGTATYLQGAARAVAFSYPLRHIRQEHKGPAAARNLGLGTAAGGTVLFLNDDCLAAPDLLAQHRKYRREFGECAVLGHIHWSPEIFLAPEVRDLVKEFYFPYYQIQDHENVSFAFFITGNLSVPLQKVREAGGFDEYFSEAAFEDIDLGYRLQRLGVRMRYNPEAVAFHFHDLDFDSLCDRQEKIAYWLYAFLAKHPEAEPFYAGIKEFAQEFPLKKAHCLRVILSYLGHRGLKACKTDLMNEKEEVRS